mgnify:CR=1 FL=1
MKTKSEEHGKERRDQVLNSIACFGLGVKEVGDVVEAGTICGLATCSFAPFLHCSSWEDSTRHYIQVYNCHPRRDSFPCQEEGSRRPISVGN